MSDYLFMVGMVIFSIAIAFAAHAAYSAQTTPRPRALLFARNGRRSKIDSREERISTIEDGCPIMIGILFERGSISGNESIMVDMHCKREARGTPMFMHTYSAETKDDGRAELVIEPSVYQSQTRHGFNVFTFWTSFGTNFKSNSLVVRVDWSPSSS